MGAFATDQSLLSKDRELIAAAAGGAPQALRSVCDRFKTPLMALALRRTADLDGAALCVEPVLHSLCRDLLNGSFSPDEWSARAVQYVAEHSGMNGPEPARQPGLAGLDAVARVAQRRVIRATLPELPLPELMAILIRCMDGATSHEMIGLVADNETEAQERLAAGYHTLLEALDVHGSNLDTS